MYCKYCGQEIEENIKFCSSCGKNLIENEKIILQVSSRNKKIGLLWILLPIAGLIIILTAYSIATYVIGEMSPNQAYEQETIMSIINVILGFLGIFCLIGIVIGVPVGIHFLNKKETINKKFDPRSGEGANSEFPEELKGWSWGAASLSWFWGIANNVWISLLMFVPLLNWIWWIILGVKGRKWAWQNQKWESIEVFNKTQKKWDNWGLGIFVFNILIFILIIVGSL